MSVFIKKMLFPILILTAAFIILIRFLTDIPPQKTTISYTLKSYKNTVALYKNEELIKTYDSIVLNTLPQKDIQSFNSGIEVTTPTQADAFLEDFDS